MFRRGFLGRVAAAALAPLALIRGGQASECKPKRIVLGDLTEREQVLIRMLRQGRLITFGAPEGFHFRDAALMHEEFDLGDGSWWFRAKLVLGPHPAGPRWPRHCQVIRFRKERSNDT